MSLLPLLLNELAESGSGSIFDQNFGLGVLSDDLSHPLMHRVPLPLYSQYYRPWRHQATRHSGISNIRNDKEGFKVSLDVQQFRPEEISVKVVDNFAVVEGIHEERKDEHGYISRQFKRRYLIPSDIDPATVTSTLSSDGVLTVSAPKKALPPPSNERSIPITQTNAPALKPQVSGKGDATPQEKMEQ